MKETSKTILITGASSGFGRDMAETLASDAHKVYGEVRPPWLLSSSEPAAIKMNFSRGEL